MSFMNSLQKGGILFDGGFGAMVIRKQIEAPECSEMMNLEMPEVVKDIHLSFIGGGSNVIESNTFGANSLYLGKYSLADKACEITEKGVKLAKEAMGNRGHVALSIGPSGGMLMPMGELSASAMLKSFYEQAKAGIAAGADAVIIETMGDISEARLAAVSALRAREELKKDVAVIASFTFEGERLLTGGTPECAALVLEAVGVDALGINCSGGPDELVTVVKRMHAVTTLPIIVQPNAGVPHMEGNLTVFPLSAQEMAPKMADIVKAGAQAIGGCCGTTPEHITLIKPHADKVGQFIPAAKKIDAAITQRAVFPVSDITGEFQQIGATVDDLYDADPDSPAVLIDISALSLNEIEELILEAQQMLKIPLCIDSSDAEKLDFALSIYGGVALTHGKGRYGAIEVR